MSFNIYNIRKDFPILEQKIYGKPLIYLDNAATTQKPKQVIDAVKSIYEQQNSNIHRGVHYLSEQLTTRYEQSREVIRKFINARHNHEVIFTSGTTHSINMVAYSFAEKFLQEGDEIIISSLEHHSNIVPWQLACERKNARLKVIPIDDTGALKMDEYEKLIGARTKLVAVTHISNALGVINDIKKIIDLAHQNDIPVLIDGAQSIQHENIDVQEIDCDFYAFSGHKVYSPNGTGILYGKEKWLEQLPPYQSGGEMIHKVTFEKTTFNELPFKFEAGTPNYVGAIGMAEAFTYINNTGLDDIIHYEKELLEYGTQKLSEIDGLKIYGTTPEKAGVISFLLDGIHFFDAGTILDKMGIAVRTGHHCADPVMQYLGIEGTLRASFAFYNTKTEIDELATGILKVKEMFG